MTLTYRLTSALVVCVGISDALTANNRTPVFPRAPPVVVQLAKHEPVFVQQIVKTIGVLSLGSILALNAGDASASASSMPFLSSSSTQLAMEVKTMDMSLPSSYDSISGAKSTGASLAKEIERTGTMPTNKVQREKSDGGGSSLASNLLPSLNKSNKKAPKEKSRVQAEEERTFENIKIVDTDMPSYSATLQKEKSAFSL